MLTVTDPTAVNLLTRGRARWVLGVFLRGENTVAEVARELKGDVRVVHRDVLALRNAGLLRVVREQKRAGRPVKVYEATAAAFFVPFSATGAAELTELSGLRARRYDALFDRASTRKFASLHHEQGAGREWGVRLYLNAEGLISVDESYEGAELVDAAVRWQGPTGLMLDARAEVCLSAAEAKEVQIELIRLLMRLRPGCFKDAPDGTGQPFLLRLGLIEVTEQELEGLM